MKIDMVATERLLPYARNARTHSPEQVSQIAASIAEFGFTNPVLIGDDDVIVAGHGRLLAAKALCARHGPDGGARGMTSQSRRQSLLEVLVSTALGLSISTATNYYALPLFGLEVSMPTAGAMAVLFTALSLVRSYFVRRIFNRGWSKQAAKQRREQPPPVEDAQAQPHEDDAG